MSNKLKVLDLFSGIGGFSLGLHSTGKFDTIKFVEIDKFCQKVLQKNFPNVPIEEDIRDVKGQEFEADVVVGGFPCQPFSVAGKQKGTNDNRYLWPQMFRLIKEIKPEFVIGENVQGLVNLQDGMVLRQVQDQLEGESFEVQCFIIPASGIGAWHQRNRVWIMAHSKHNGYLAAESRCNAEKNKNESEVKQKIFTTGKSVGTNSNGETNQGHERSNGSTNDEDVWHSKSTRRKSSSDRQGQKKFWRTSAPRVQRQETWWETESKLCGVPHGLSTRLDRSRSERIKSLGNAIVPQMARILGLTIKKILIQEDR